MQSSGGTGPEVSAILETQGLIKRYGDLVAVDGVDLAVRPGEIFGFLGPNGAGKSTTIKILSTLLKPTAGKAWLAGFDVATQPDRVRQSIGLVFQDPSLDNRLTAEENLRFHGMLYGVPKPTFAGRMAAVLEMVDLADRKKDLVSTFSGGMKRRLEIARGLLHEPKVLFLDEPTVGLDPQTRIAIWEHVRRLRAESGVTVFMTTHYMDEAENCDRIAILDHGKLQALDTPEVLKQGLGGDTVVVAGDAELEADLAARYGVAVRATNGSFHFQMARAAEFVPKVVADFPDRIKAISVKQPSLDDVFLSLTGRAIREEEVSARDRMRQMARAWGRGR